MTQTLLFRDRLTAWREFHRANPQVFALFVRFSKEARKQRGRFGARMIGERIRWYTQVETNGDEYRLNDHWWPYYARLAMLTEPDLAGFFETRGARFDATDSDLLEAHGGTT